MSNGSWAAFRAAEELPDQPDCMYCCDTGFVWEHLRECNNRDRCWDRCRIRCPMCSSEAVERGEQEGA